MYPKPKNTPINLPYTSLPLPVQPIQLHNQSFINLKPSITLLINTGNNQFNDISVIGVVRNERCPFYLRGVAAGSVHGPFLKVDFIEDLDAEVAVFGVGYCHRGEYEGGMEMGKYEK
jgi:hypothetical protein